MDLIGSATDKLKSLTLGDKDKKQKQKDEEKSHTYPKGKETGFSPSAPPMEYSPRKKDSEDNKDSHYSNAEISGIRPIYPRVNTDDDKTDNSDDDDGSSSDVYANIPSHRVELERVAEEYKSDQDLAMQRVQNLEAQAKTKLEKLDILDAYEQNLKAMQEERERLNILIKETQKRRRVFENLNANDILPLQSRNE